MKTLTISKRSFLGIGMAALLLAVLIPQAALAAPPAGVDPNNATELSVVPGQTVVKTGQLGPGEEVWYEVTVSDVAGLYLNSGSDLDDDDLDQVPFDLTVFVSPVDGNTIQNIRMDLFPASYAEHWSHGHGFDESLIGDDELHAFPFGAGRIVERGEETDLFYYTYDDDAGAQELGTLTWSGAINNNESFLVSVRNGNEAAVVDYALFTDQIVNAETGQLASSAEAVEAGPTGSALAAEMAMAELADGIDPNNAIRLAVVPDETVVKTGKLGPGQEVWYEATVDDVAGLYLNTGSDLDDDDQDQVPLDLTAFVSPVDGNTIRNIRMDLFPASYAEHWSHGHGFDESLIGDDELHAVPFGAGRIVERGEETDLFYYTYDDDAGAQELGTLAWSGAINNSEPFLVRIYNGNEAAVVGYALFTDQIVNAETDQIVSAEAEEAGPTGTVLAAEMAIAKLAAGIDPNNAIRLAVVPDETIVRAGELGPGQEVWYAMTVEDVAGLYLNSGSDIDDDDLNQVPIDLTVFASPVDGNTIQQIRMDLFPDSYAEHWSHGHGFDESLVGDDELHAVPFGAGRIAERGEETDLFYYTYDDDAGTQELGTLAWSGMVNNGQVVLVRIYNGNGSLVDYVLVTDQAFNNAGY